MYTPVVSSKTIPDSKPKWAKCFQTTKTGHKPYPLGQQIRIWLISESIPRVLTPFMIVRGRDHV